MAEPLLVILNPRRIPECMEAFAALDVAKAYLRGYTENGLCEPFSRLLTASEHSPLVVVSDDVVVTQEALDAVIATAADHPVATGYCNLDESSPLINLTRSKLKGDSPTPESYDWYSRDELDQLPDPIWTGFSGMCLTAMSLEMWQRFPFGCFPSGNGCASDFHLCMRLRDAGVPIVAPKAGWVRHLKRTWNTGDHTPGRELLIGVDQGIHWEAGA